MSLRAWPGLVLIGALAACGDDKDPEDKPDSGSEEDGGVDAGKDAGEDAGPMGTGPVAIGDTPPLGEACDGKAKAGVDGAAPTFERVDIASTAGAAFMRPVDIDDDGFPELVVTSISQGIDPAPTTPGPPLTPGTGTLLTNKGGKPTGELGTWTSSEIFGIEDALYWANNSDLVDIDNDGLKDLVVGGGFLGKPFGKIGWAKGTLSGGFESGLTLIPVPDESCWYHLALTVDMDGDDDEDFVTTCHVGMTRDGADRTHWFENPGDGTSDFEVHEIGEGGGSLLTLFDVDDDGDQDVLLPQFFANDLIWYEQTEAKGAAWARHQISTGTGHGFIVKLADMNGDGKLDLVYGNHNNEEDTDEGQNVMGIYWYEVPPKAEVASLENWNDYKHVVYEGFEVNGTANADSAGAPGMINVGDVDGDCDIDVVASGDGDDGIYLFLHQAGEQFEQVTLDENELNVNSGEIHVLDIDADGDHDIVGAVFGPLPGFPDFEIKSKVAAFIQQ